MIANLSDVLALEISKRDHEGKTYHNLVVYEFGQRFPQVRVLGVKPELVEVAQKCVGKKVSIAAEIYENKGRVSLSFLGISA